MVTGDRGQGKGSATRIEVLLRKGAGLGVTLTFREDSITAQSGATWGLGWQHSHLGVIDAGPQWLSWDGIVVGTELVGKRRLGVGARGLWLGGGMVGGLQAEAAG